MKFTLNTSSGLGKNIPSNAKVELTRNQWNRFYTHKEDTPVLWSIELDSMEDLLGFSKTVPEGIIITSNAGIWTEDIAKYNIEIYDDYRE